RGALESHAAGDSFDDYVRDGSSVHLHGPACGDDCPHLSRVSKQTHVSRSREDQHRRGRRVMNGAEAKRSRGEEEQRGRRAASFTSAPLPLCSSAPPLLRSSAVRVAGVPVANLTEDETVAAIDKLISVGGSHYAAVVNAAKIVAAHRDDQLKQNLLDADMVTA